MKKRNAILLVVFIVTCAFNLTSIAGVTYFEDGGTHIIGVLDTVQVNNDISTGASTTVELRSYSSIDRKLITFGTSNVIMSGGSIGTDLFVYGGNVTMSGGSVGGWFETYGSNEITMSGGSVELFLAGGTSQITISGGEIERGLHARDNSFVTMSGGKIERISLYDEAELILNGSNFHIDGSPINIEETIGSTLGGDYTSEPYRRITGTLANGDIINSLFLIGNNASISLIPEPATLMLLGLGGIILRRRKNI